MDWRIKLGTQFLLARLPFGIRLNHVLQILHGRHSAKLARHRLQDLAANFSRIRNAGLDLDGACVVEIGTGWNAINTLILFALGVREVHTYDLNRHVRSHLVRRAVSELDELAEVVAEQAGVPAHSVKERLARLRGKHAAEDIFSAAGIHYHAPADATRTGLDSSSVDLVYSYAVLEHVGPDTIRRMNEETRRILRPTGLAYHGIGLHDHFTGVDRDITAVNFLQYSDRWWDFFVQNEISYHNRLREKDFLEIFARDGFEVVSRKNVIDPKSLGALDHMQLDAKFRGYTPEELAVIHSTLVLKPRCHAGELRTSAIAADRLEPVASPV